MGSNYYPAGPHGRRQDPREIPHHPESERTQSASNGSDSDDSYAPAPVYAGGASAGGGIGLLVGSFLFVCILWSVWACLYPLPALAGAATFFLVDAILKPVILSFDRTAVDVAHVASFTVGMIVLVKASRFEHRRLALHRAYTIPRYFIRLPLFGLLAFRWIVLDQHFLPAPGQKWIDFRLLAFPENQVVLTVVMIIAALVLWKADGLRHFWHNRLESIGLRPQT